MLLSWPSIMLRSVFRQAANYLKEVRVGRNCLGDVDLGIVDMETFKARLLGEVRREFFQEGQTFFITKSMEKI